MPGDLKYEMDKDEFIAQLVNAGWSEEEAARE